MNEMPAGPDLTKGVAVSAIADGSIISGHVRGEPVLLVRRDLQGLKAEVAFEVAR